MKQGTEYNRNYRASLPPSRRRPSPPQLYSSAHRRGRAYVTLPTSRPSRGPGPPRHNTSKHGSVCTQRGVQKDSRTRSAMRYRSAPRCWGRCCADPDRRCDLYKRNRPCRHAHECTAAMPKYTDDRPVAWEDVDNPASVSTNRTHPASCHRRLPTHRSGARAA